MENLIKKKVKVKIDISYFEDPKKIFARQGDRVNVFADLGHVVVAKNVYGEKFCIAKHDIE